ncbi:hypothetical protein MNJPNG_05035 [Cupriavidus oxalaticus]|uniref:hypothetical protein n=1 Tax=Cupriavidus oxalaticus TaxID=96344 RepID=UPI003F741BE3
MKKAAAILLATLAINASASDLIGSGERTSIDNGAGWAISCNKEGGPADVCVAFVAGVFIGAAADGVKRFGICLPDGGVPYAVMAKNFGAFLRRNPDKQQWNSGSLVMMSLVDEFACDPKLRRKR